MKKFSKLVAVLAMFSMAALLTGCGDDDDDGDDDNNGTPNPNPVIVAPTNEVALTRNKIYTVNVAGQIDPITLTFPALGQYQMVQGGVTETGTYSGAERAGNTWGMNLTPAAGQDGTQPGALRLNFVSTMQGVWTFTPTGGGPESGTFTVATSDPDPGPDPGPAPNPISLAGQTLQLTYPNAFSETFSFVTDTSVFYQTGGANGTYTWDRGNRRINASLETGQLYEITLVNNSSANVIFRETAAATPETFTATFTLQ